MEAAWRRIGEMMTAVQTTKESWWEAVVYRVAGEIALKSPEPDAAKAEQYFERALAVARQQQAKSWELRATIVMRTRAREDQGVVGKLGHAHASKHREIKIGKIYTNFAKQSSSELNGSSLSSAKRRWMRASWGEYDDAFLFSSYV